MLNWLKQRFITALLMTLLCCSGYLYYRGYGHWQDQQQQISQQASLLNRLEQQFSQQVSQQEFKQRFEWQERVLLDMQHASTLQHQQLEKLRVQILRLTGSHNKDWPLIGAYDLLRKAERKLWLDRDLLTARRLLQRAESMCAALGGAASLSILQALMEDSRHVAAAISSDNEGTLLDVIALIDQLDLTPHLARAQAEAARPHVADTPLGPGPTEGGHSERLRWYQLLLHHGERLIHRFVTIQRYAAPAGHAFSPGEPLDTSRYCESLRAYLLLAAQAAARQQHERYQQWLASAVSLLQTRFDSRVPSVTLLLEKLEQLRQHASGAKLPQKLESLRLLEGMLQSWTEDVHIPVSSEKRVEQP